MKVCRDNMNGLNLLAFLSRKKTEVGIRVITEMIAVNWRGTTVKVQFLIKLKRNVRLIV
jgi:hypothetical protein